MWPVLLSLPPLSPVSATVGWPQPPIFQRLDEVNVSWRVYFTDGPTSLLFQYTRTNESLRKHHFFENFYNVSLCSCMACQPAALPLYAPRAYAGCC
jgi:hypothetical protein